MEDGELIVTTWWLKSTLSLVFGQSEVIDTLPRKAHIIKPVPQTNTGSRDEYSKELEWSVVKELGKLTL